RASLEALLWKSTKPDPGGALIDPVVAAAITIPLMKDAIMNVGGQVGVRVGASLCVLTVNPELLDGAEEQAGLIVFCVRWSGIEEIARGRIVPDAHFLNVWATNSNSALFAG